MTMIRGMGEAARQIGKDVDDCPDNLEPRLLSGPDWAVWGCAPPRRVVL